MTPYAADTGRHTPFHNKYRPSSSEKERGITINTSHTEYGTSTNVRWARAGRLRSTRFDDDGFAVPRRRPRARPQVGTTIRLRDPLRSSLGQTTTWSYDVHGNCTGETSPIPGRGELCEYNARGQCTAATTLNGAASPFRDEFTYDAASGFLESIACDSTGLALTTSLLRDDLGRVSSVTDPRGADTLYAYNPLHQCVQVSSPPAPNRIVTTLTIDSGGYPVRCDTEHRAPDGSLNSANPAYSTYYFYDTVGQLIRVAHEDRPTTDFDELAIGDFAGLRHHLQRRRRGRPRQHPRRLPRDQASDRACAYTYDERGFLHRVHEGDTGNPADAGIVTTECDYDTMVISPAAPPSSRRAHPECLYTYDGFHRPTSVTDPMGNVATYAYANNGAVTCSVFGETTDLPGSAGNVLLATSTSSRWQIPAPDSRPHRDKSKHQEETEPRVQNLGQFGLPKGTDRLLPPQRRGRHRHRRTLQPRWTAGHSKPPSSTARPLGSSERHPQRRPARLTYDYDSNGALSSVSDAARTVDFTRDAPGTSWSAARPTTPRRLAAEPRPTPLTRVSMPSTASSRSPTAPAMPPHRLRLARPPCRAHRPRTPRRHHRLRRRLRHRARSARRIARRDHRRRHSRSSLRAARALRGTGQQHRLQRPRTTFTRDALDRVTRCDHPGRHLHRLRACDSLGRVASARPTRTGTVCPSNTTSTAASPASPGPSPSRRDPQRSHRLRTMTASAAASAPTREPRPSLAADDSLGNPTSETQNGHTVTRTFNHRGRTSVTYPDGKAFAETRDALGRSSRISALDALGAPISPPVVVA